MNLKQTIKSHFTGPGGFETLLKIALPLMVSNTCETVMLFTDRLFLSQLSPAHMSATMGGGLTAFTFSTFFVGLIGYTTAMVAQKLGAGKKDACALVTTQALLITPVAYLIIIACIPLGIYFFKTAHIAPEQLPLQIRYFTILMFAAFIPFLRNCFSNFFSGIGRTRLIMLSSFISMSCNVGFNYVLIFGKLGFPALGIEGAAYGTIAAGVLGTLVLCGAYFRKSNRREFQIKNNLRLDKRIMKQLWQLGSPAGIELFLTLVAFTTLVTLFHAQGLATASAITIVFNWDMVVFIPLIGMNISVTSLVGRYLGAQDLASAYKTVRSGFILACLYLIGLMTAFLSIPALLVDLFQPNGTAEHWPEIRTSAIYMVRLISIYLFADALRIVYGGALRGAGDTLWAMTLAVTMHWLLAAQTYLLFHFFALDAKTVWLLLTLTLVVLSSSYYLRYTLGNWQKKGLKLAH